MESENPASLPMSLSACPMRPAPTMVHAQSLLTAAILRPCPAETAPPPRSWYAARDTLAGAGTISLRMRIRPRACECTCVKTHSLLGSQHRLIEQGSSLREPFDVRYTCTQAQVSADSRSYSACSEIPCRRHYKAARKLRGVDIRVSWDKHQKTNVRSKVQADTHSAQLSALSPGAGPGRPRARRP